jgi:hypothetical protein
MGALMLRAIFRLTTVACMLYAAGNMLYAAGNAVADESPERRPVEDSVWLRYGERALRGDDFQAPVPEQPPELETPIHAYSETEVRYEIQRNVVGRRGRMRAQLTAIDIFAVLVKDKSWNKKPQDTGLLDHHQGHFDLTQIAAYELQLELREALQKERLSLVGEGKSEPEATQDLLKKIEKRMATRIAELVHEHRYFDIETRYGTNAEVERSQREKQKDKLAELQEQLKPAATPR